MSSNCNCNDTEAHPRICLPKSFVWLRVFSPGPRAPNTSLERVSTEGPGVGPRWGLLISNLRRGFGNDFLRKTVQILFRHMARISRRYLSPSFPVPKDLKIDWPRGIAQSFNNHVTIWLSSNLPLPSRQGAPQNKKAPRCTNQRMTQ